MRKIVVCFASEQTAIARVAALPLAARAMREASIAAQSLPDKPNIQLLFFDGRLRSDWCRDEIDRLVPGGSNNIVTLDGLYNGPTDIFIAGECLHDANVIEASMHSHVILSEQYGVADNVNGMLKHYETIAVDDFRAEAHKLSKAVLRSTIKPSDGIVSRKINRPMSMTISGVLLRSDHIRPIHATALNALAAIAMLICFLTGSYTGMIMGAILFQTASMLDGVDGEIARATFRTSDFGASLDSITDAATNLSFIVGLGISLYLQDIDQAITLALIGSVCLGLGMFLLGRNAVTSGEHVNFDGLKHMVRQKNIPFADWLIWITMRDFLALASAVMVVLGWGIVFLKIFAVGAILWLLVALFKVMRD